MLLNTFALQVSENKNQFPSIMHYNKENIPNHIGFSLDKPQTSLNPEDSKEKSQLCRSYMDFGFCPYEARCKFAHGSHELLKNNQLNNKYKTKQCENFKKNICCMYGKRCNFIHTHEVLEKSEAEGKNDVILRLARKQLLSKSKLLHLLH